MRGSSVVVVPNDEVRELLPQAIGPACHELRSPLAVVYGFARMLEDSDDLDEPAVRYVAQIARGAERLDRQLDALSQLGRIAAGRIAPNVEHASIAEIVESVASTGPNATRVVVERGTAVALKVDAAWTTDALLGTIDGLCYDESISVRLTWRHEPHEAVIELAPVGAQPLIDLDPTQASLAITLARMRVLAMGGTYDGGDDSVRIVLPRH